MKNRSRLKLLSLILALAFSFSLLPAQLVKAAVINKSATIDYYAINDFHGTVDQTASSSNPGIARIETYLKARIAENPNSYFLSVGDQYQGSAVSNLTYGDVVNDILEHMNLLTSAIGNHEFDWGAERIPQWAKEGGFEFIASNIEVDPANKPAEWDTYVKPYYIHTVQVDGVDYKIGFIGIATPETAYKTAAANVVGFTFTDPVAATMKYTAELRDVEKVDAVIALTHLGAFQDATTKVITGEIVNYANGVDVDAIFSGHTHQIVDGVVNGIPVVQGQYNGRSLSKIRLNFTTVETDGVAAKTLASVDGESINIRSLIPTLPEDPAVKQLIADYYTILQPILEKQLGVLNNDLPHDTDTMQLTPMGQFVAKVMAEMGKTQIAIINGGGIRGGLTAGNVTMGHMYTLLPFDNTLVTLKLTGAELKKIVEHGIMPATFRPGQFYGLEVWYNPEAAAGSRITKITLADGTPISDTEVYSVATLDFLLTGGDKYDYSKATDVVDTVIPVRDMIAGYIESKGVLDVPYEDMMHKDYDEVVSVVDYYSINDFHGNVDSSGSSKNPGLARIQAYLEAQRLLNPNTFFLSSGDHFQGTAISNLTYGEVVNDILKEMGILASALGNHEFDWGSKLIPLWASNGGYKYLASNIEVKAENKPAGWDENVVPYLIQDLMVGGKPVKVGFIGIATPETAYKVAAQNVVGFTFTDPVAAANHWAEVLRKDMGVDAVVALTHLGAFQNTTTKEVTGEAADFAKKVTGIDAIFTGHTHQTVDGVVNGIPVVQGSYNGRGLSKISLEFTIAGPDVTLTGVSGDSINMTSLIPTLTMDPEVKAIVDSYYKELAPILEEVLGELKTDLPHDTDTQQLTPMGQFVAKALAEIGGTQIAIINGGGIRRGFEAGPITMGLMYELLPFDNTLVTLKVTGAELKKLLEHGLMPENFRPGQFYGIEVWYDDKAPAGERISTIRLLDGTLVKDDGIYTVSTLDFLLTGGDSYDFKKATDVVDTYMPVRDLIVEYIAEEGTIEFTFAEHLHIGTAPVTPTLPSTGSAGDFYYMGMGLATMAGAVLLLKKKKKTA